MSDSTFKLERPPLIFMLAQVLMSPIAKIDKYVPDIQDELRKTSFPLFAKRKLERYNVAFPEKKVETHAVSTYRFGNAANDTIILLDEQGCVLQTSRYTTYEEVMGLFKEALEAIRSVTGAHLALRLGLRYVNLIRTDFSHARDYVDPSLLGLPAQLLGEGFEAIQRSSVLEDHDANQRVMLTQVHQVRGPGLPPGLDPMGLAMDHISTPNNGVENVILDIDHFVERQIDFKPATLMNEFAVLHRGVEQRFTTVVTSHALESWGHQIVGGGEGS